jgi:hypothetical protein
VTVFGFKGVPEQASHRRVVVYNENERLNTREAFLLSQGRRGIEGVKRRT